MTLYFVSYDLRKTRDYKPLTESLEKLGAIRVLESLWSLKNDATVGQVRDHLKVFIDGDDGLLVIQAVNWAGTNLLATPHQP